ncbi:40S ribosomal protein S27-like [Cyprinus carpio]|uniref:40S ribosomal protein S27 n=2 Tax=Cyprinus carpio TaxID=7962 RepID=A0A8C1RDX7_CYPCA|nr:40S ribosomal protein S27-like [Cyprinus carpio]
MYKGVFYCGACLGMSLQLDEAARGNPAVIERFEDSSRLECESQQLPTMPLAKDLLNPSFDFERRQHKKKRLVQSPNSYFMDVKCPGCYKITTVFSHAQTVVLCVGCSTVLCQPTGGKARLTEGCSFRRKQH